MADKITDEMRSTLNAALGLPGAKGGQTGQAVGTMPQGTMPGTPNDGVFVNVEGRPNPIRIAPAILDKLRSDPAFDAPGMPPNYGEHVLPHVTTMQGLVNSVSRVYRMDDEALRDSLQNARYMELDIGIRECLEARWRSVALLNWHLEPDDPTSTEQREFCDHFTKLLKKIPRFMQFRENLCRAIWYGRYAASLRYGWVQCGPNWYLNPAHWRPVHGDKLVFRIDDGQPDHDPDQIGIRVGYTTGDRPGGWDDRIETTDRGRAYFLTPAERRLIVLHKHQCEDAPYEDISAAGRIHGFGIRSRVYWEWFQKQETLRWMMEYLERSAFGLDLWFYPEGNASYLTAMKKAANERVSNFRNQIFVPVPVDGSSNQYGAQHIETGMAGMQQLQELVTKYFGHRIKRLILGQTLTSESEGGGLGSDGIANVHLATFRDIVRYDATNVEETITEELIKPIKEWNFPAARGFAVRFVIETEEIDADERIGRIQQVWQMGARVSEKAILDAVGLTIPGEDDRTLINPQMAQQGPQPGQPGHLPRDGGLHDQMAADVRAHLADEGALQQSPADQEMPQGAQGMAA